MMKTFYLICSVSFLMIACSSPQKEKAKTGVEVSHIEIDSNNPLVYSFIRPISNYFAISKVTKETTLSLDSIQFEKEFHFAATMNNKPAKIDFSRERVGVIILPETPYDTKILIDTNFVKSDTLHILYSIERGKEKRTFTISPTKLFSYNSKFHLVFSTK